MRIQVTQKICHYMVLTVFLILAILVDISKDLKKYVTFAHEILIIFTFWVPYICLLGAQFLPANYFLSL